MFQFPQLQPFSLLAKPTGPVCNLNCSYCYYLEKANLYKGVTDFQMSDDTLENFTRKYIHEQPGIEVNFAWQGGEPTLLGLDFFKKALELQKKYGKGKRISNSFQTNGLLLDHQWCQFFKDNNFLLGISVDGPEHLHDAYRINKGGQGTFAKVMKGIELLRNYKVEFNTLTVINNLNVEKPLEVYRFLKEIGSCYLQFIPIVERAASACASGEASLVAPEFEGEAKLTSWSVSSVKYGEFMIEVFKEWVKRDVGRIFVQLFDVTLANEVGAPPGLCIFDTYCGNALAVEHNGDIYSCDHYVYPEYKIGNLNQSALKKILLSARQTKFGTDKYNSLPMQCKQCEVYKYCKGECPKHRFLSTTSGEKGLNYLCEGYKSFFRFVKPYMSFMANQIRNSRPAANVMHLKKL